MGFALVVKFERVARCVTEVERLSFAARIAFVGTYYRGFVGDAVVSYTLQKVLGKERAGIFAEGSVDIFVERAIFYYFAQPAANFAAGKGAEKERVDDNLRRLVERADYVLYPLEIDGGFAADRTVDLREEGRRNLHEVDAAHVERGGESCNVAHHPSAEGDDRRRAGYARFEHGGQDF